MAREAASAVVRPECQATCSPWLTRITGKTLRTLIDWYRATFSNRKKPRALFL
jgi:hypothetical protein